MMEKLVMSHLSMNVPFLKTLKLVLLGITFYLLISKGYDKCLEGQFSCGMKGGLPGTRMVKRILSEGSQ